MKWILLTIVPVSTQPSDEMSVVSSISQSNKLDEDVLLMIFQKLEGEDLVNCEAVCHGVGVTFC